MAPARLIIVGVPGDKRTTSLLQAAARMGVEAQCIAWLDALSEPRQVGRAGRAGDYLRVESPGSDATVWSTLARLGGDERPRLPAEWRPGRGWFRGLTMFLTELELHTRELVPSHPGPQILAMTDKLVCQQRLASAGVPVPQLLPAAHSAAELRQIMQAERCRAVYVKPRWGSSGAGVLAFRCASDREQLTTTGRWQDGRLFNHKKLRRYVERPVVDRFLDTMLCDGALVQRWLPKAGTAAGPFDMRVLVMRGQAAHAVGRVSRGTITNLHLDATRVRIDQLLAPFGPSTCSRVYTICERAAACFPGHQVLGVDVMIEPQGRVSVLECNAWGDYLPRLLHGQMDSHELYLAGLHGTSREARELA